MTNHFGRGLEGRRHVPDVKFAAFGLIIVFCRAAWMWSSLRLIQDVRNFASVRNESNDTRWNNLNGGFARFKNNGIWGNFFFAKIGREELFI